jgi:hypothetical protein
MWGAGVVRSGGIEDYIIINGPASDVDIKNKKEGVDHYVVEEIGDKFTATLY